MILDFRPLLWLGSSALTLLCFFIIGCSGQTIQHNDEALEKSHEDKVSNTNSNLEIVYEYIKANPDLFHLKDPQDQLTLLSENTDEYGLVHLKFNQTLHGFPVWSKVIIFHIRDGEVYRVDGEVVKIPRQFNLTPAISKETAEGNAKQVLDGTMVSTLVIYPDAELPLLAYRVEVKKGLNRKFVFVNAQNGDIEQVIEGTPSL